MNYTKKQAAAERLSEQLFEKGVFVSPKRIIEIVDSIPDRSPKETIFTLQSVSKFPKETKVANTRHAKYGNTFLK